MRELRPPYNEVATTQEASQEASAFPRRVPPTPADQFKIAMESRPPYGRQWTRLGSQESREHLAREPRPPCNENSNPPEASQEACTFSCRVRPASAVQECYGSHDILTNEIGPVRSRDSLKRKPRSPYNVVATRVVSLAPRGPSESRPPARHPYADPEKCSA